MFRKVVLCLAILSLGGCFYKSSKDLRQAGTEQEQITDFFPAGRHVFLSEDERQLLMLEVGPEESVADLQDWGKGIRSVDMLGVMRSEGLPEDVHVAVGINITGNLYYYFPFRSDESHIEWLSFEGRLHLVSSLSELEANIHEIDAAGGSVSFKTVPVEQHEELIARFAAENQRTTEELLNGQPAEAAQ
ncbi:MAG: hypothetical protein ACK5JR_14700 [Tropicimonas sp.]|uniref:hypothetical protein n=1 Tax=Tropicimonas sp. TaxID=2067044 RepID=UPI003A84E161